MAIKITKEAFTKKFGVTPEESKPPTGFNLGISDAFKGGISQMKEGYQQGKTATNPLQLLEGGTKLAAGAFGALYSPLAPLNKPIEKGVNYVANKISDIPAVQKFAMSKVGESTSRVAEDVGNVAMIAGGVAGLKGAKPVAKAVAKPIKPAIAGAGRTLKAGGEGSYGITVPPSEGTARMLQKYKESTPNLITRIKNTVTGETKGKPTTEANTAARYGLIGTEQEIGVQAGRYMDSTWKNTVQPALKNAKGKLDMKSFWDVLKNKIIKENPEINRRKALLEGLDDVKSGYSKVSKVGLEKLQEYKEGWTKFQSEQVWKGKPIAGTAKEVTKMAGDIARDFIYKNTPDEVKQAYIDYGNLKSIREAGIKSGVGDLAKKSISRGAWQFVMDKAVTPIATTMGKILYRTGEGLEFIGESGAKKVGDIVGSPKQYPSNP